VNFKVVSPGLHAVADHVLDLALVAVPMLVGFTGLARWLSVGVGITNFTYSQVTAYQAQDKKVLPFKVHLGFDVALGVALLAGAFVGQLSGFALAYYVLNGVGIIAAVVLTRPA
jgi:ABC-type antimicrobial peptide transport system permease subunit